MSDTYKDALDRYQWVIDAFDGIVMKGKANRYTSMNGNMFSFLDKEGTICMRLPADARAAFKEKHGTGDVIQYGAVMREYIGVPDEVAADEASLKELFAQSVAYARTLKAKSTKKT